MTRPRITVAVPFFNAASTLPRVLQGLRLQTRPPDEILLVDDGSTDQGLALVRASGFRTHRNPQNLGLATTRNRCLELARGEIVVFIDADAMPHPDLVHYLIQGYEDPRLAAVGGQVLEVERGPAADRWRALFWRQTQGTHDLTEAPFFIGACCSLRRRHALEVGGFDQRFCSNGEDVGMSIKLRRRRLRIGYQPRAQVLHLRHDSIASLLAMVHRHSRDHVRALRGGGNSSARVIYNAVRWGPVTTFSSLRRHRSFGLAALSPLCYLSSLSGCALGLSSTRRPFF